MEVAVVAGNHLIDIADNTFATDVASLADGVVIVFCFALQSESCLDTPFPLRR